MIMEANRIRVPIFFKYWTDFSHMWCMADFRVGTLYGGSSITNGVSSPFIINRLNILAEITATSIPKTYNDSITIEACSGKNTLENNTYTGSLAVQDINGITSMVMSLLCLLSSVLVAIMAGTLQPNPISIGTKDFPCNPILCIILSIINAARDR